MEALVEKWLGEVMVWGGGRRREGGVRGGGGGGGGCAAGWAGGGGGRAEGDPLMLDYHDREWGVPVHDDRLLFEFLILEGAQAGLSWMTILRKRDAYRKAFKDFEPASVARFREAAVDRLLTNSAIVRNRAKIESAIRNARVIQAIAKEHASFDRYAWSFVGGRPKRNAW